MRSETRGEGRAICLFLNFVVEIAIPGAQDDPDRRQRFSVLPRSRLLLDLGQPRADNQDWGYGREKIRILGRSLAADDGRR